MSIDAMKQALEALGIGDPWHPTTIAAIKALNAAIEQAQEPVCDKDPQGCWNVRCQLGKVCKHTLRQWQGLTDEEIRRIELTVQGYTRQPFDGKAFDRAIEAELKRKNT